MPLINHKCRSKMETNILCRLEMKYIDTGDPDTFITVFDPWKSLVQRALDRLFQAGIIMSQFQGNIVYVRFATIPQVMLDARAQRVQSLEIAEQLRTRSAKDNYLKTHRELLQRAEELRQRLRYIVPRHVAFPRDLPNMDRITDLTERTSEINQLAFALERFAYEILPDED